MNEDTNVVLEQESLEMVDEKPASEDALKTAIEEQMSRLRRQSMLLGFQVSSKAVLDKINAHAAKPGKKTYRDYERLIADIKSFCEQSLSRNVGLDGETTPVDTETVQNY